MHQECWLNIKFRFPKTSKESLNFIEKQLAFLVGIPVARRLMNQDEIIEFSVKLRSLKDEAKNEDDESGIDDD